VTKQAQTRDVCIKCKLGKKIGGKFFFSKQIWGEGHCFPQLQGSTIICLKTKLTIER
jgi:hypothetical protein